MALFSLYDLHQSLYSRFQKYNLNLQAVTECTSAVAHSDADTSTIAYLRPIREAQNVESIMGRDIPGRRLDLRRHPVIELRTVGSGVVLEFILPPDAWCDQQNFVGKMSVERHRSAFRRMLCKLDERFSLNFSNVTQLDSSSLTLSKATHPAIFETWISTFSYGQDWLRIGVSYEEMTDEMTSELFRHAQALYEIYTFISWTGNNDFRSFAQRQNHSTPVYA